MTCIIGFVEDNKVYMGADSVGSDGYFTTDRVDSKVFINGEFIMGYTSSFRMGQLLRYKFNPPQYNDKVCIHKYMCTEFVDSLINCFRSNFYGQEEKGEKFGGDFLVGFKGRLFTIASDFQVGEQRQRYASVGGGLYFAYGCLYGLADLAMSVEKKITKALEAAEKYCATVKGPFTILHI